MRAPIARDELGGVLVTLADAVERQHRRPRRVLHRDGGAVAAGQALERAHRGVVHVAGAGGGREHQPGAVERAGAVELGHRERDALVLGRCALEPDVGADRVPDRWLVHHLRDHVGAEHVPDVPAALAGEGLEGHEALELPLTSGTGGGRSNAVSKDSSLRSMFPSTLRAPARETGGEAAEDRDAPDRAPERRRPGQHPAQPATDHVGHGAGRGAEPHAAPATPSAHRERLRDGGLCRCAGRPRR